MSTRSKAEPTTATAMIVEDFGDYLIVQVQPVVITAARRLRSLCPRGETR